MSESSTPGDNKQKELRDFISHAKRYLWGDLPARRVMEKHGICLTPARFYNEIPTIEEIETGFEVTEDEPYAFDFMDRAVIESVLEALVPFAEEYAPPKEESGPGYFWGNPAFGRADGLAYYSFIRQRQPETILEVGSGYSTLAALDAVERNGKGRIHCIEPYPMERLENRDITISRDFVQKFDAEFFNDQLKDGDILFIDSSHTVKMSSDCAHLYLRILPHIRRDILVHVHDIYWPLGVPQKWGLDLHIYWTEHQLLAAYLLDNPKIRFQYGQVAAERWLPEAWRKFAGRDGSRGGSVWFELHGNKS